MSLRRRGYLTEEAAWTKADLRKIMSRYKSAKEFEQADLDGRGFTRISDVVAHINRGSRGNINLGAYRRELANGSSLYVLYEIPVSKVDAHTHGEVKPSGKENLSSPIVIGRKNAVLDGRHRVMLARKKGVRTLPAYMTLGTAYKEVMG